MLKEERIKELEEEILKNKKDLLWLRALEAAGVDNWEGIEFAQEILEQLEREDV